jgi:hypothetical protein
MNSMAAILFTNVSLFMTFINVTNGVSSLAFTTFITWVTMYKSYEG